MKRLSQEIQDLIHNNNFCRPIEESETIGLPGDFLRQLYATMLRIRIIEEAIAELVEQDQVICPCHLYIGQEAVATGACAALGQSDHVYSTHRSHGHYIAKGGPLKPLFAEIFGRATGCSGGHGGSMHLVAPELGYMGSSAIVGGSMPLAVGSALAFSLQSNKNVAVSFFGDGAATEGILYECLNFATLMNAPVIFLCENNFYSTHMHISAIQSTIELYKKAGAFGLASLRIDGNNVIEVYRAMEDAVERARSGEGPTFIECVTYRWRGHVGPNWDLDKGLRSKEEVEWWVGNCAVKRMERFIIGQGLMSAANIAELKQRINKEIEEAISYAKESPYPDVNEYRHEVFIE